MTDHSSLSLKLANAKDIQNEIHQNLNLSQELGENLAIKAEQCVKELVDLDLSQTLQQRAIKIAFDSLGAESQHTATHQNNLLKQPIHTLAIRTSDGSEIARAFADLKLTIEYLDPFMVDFKSGWLSRLLSLVPGIDITLKSYMTKFEGAQSAISSIVRSLKSGKDQLLKDNTILKENQIQLWKTMHHLITWSEFAQLLGKHLTTHLNESPISPDKYQCVQENIVYAQKQRTLYLQQSITIQQQSILLTELITRYNEELILGIERSLDEIESALKAATATVFGLSQENLNKVGQIASQSSTDPMNGEALKAAFQNLKHTLDELESFRREALAQITQILKDFDHICKENQQENLNLNQEEQGYHPLSSCIEEIKDRIKKDVL